MNTITWAKTITWAVLFAVVSFLQSPSLSAINWNG